MGSHVGRNLPARVDSFQGNRAAVDDEPFWERMAKAGLVLQYAFWFAVLCAGFTMMVVILFEKSHAMWLGYRIGQALAEPTYFEIPVVRECLPEPRVDPPL